MARKRSISYYLKVRDTKRINTYFSDLLRLEMKLEGASRELVEEYDLESIFRALSDSLYSLMDLEDRIREVVER